MARNGFLVLVVASLGVVAGCGYEGRKMSEPADITGTVTFADGRPVKDVQLVLRPKSEGHPAAVSLSPDGKFSVKIVPGDTMFFFQLTEDPKVDRARARTGFAAVPTKYQDVSVENAVSLSTTGPNVIKLGS